MLENQNEIRKITSSLIKYFDTQKEWDISTLLKKAYPSSKEVGYDNWNGGTSIYSLVFELEIEDYTVNRSLIESYCEVIRESAELFLQLSYDERLDDVKIVPICRHYLSWSNLDGLANKNIMLKSIENIKNIMIAVSTGGSKIQSVETEYKKMYGDLDKWLDKLLLENPNPYKSLWAWYDRWRQADLKTYASRRTFIPKIYKPLVDIIENEAEESVLLEYESTGWDRVDRAVYEMKRLLVSSINEEQFQTIGMLGRETLITIAQQVFDYNIHKTVDGIEASNTDSKRMLEAFLNYELAGSSNERTRKFAKSAVDMANHLTHDRTASKRDASMCLTSVTAVASLIKSIDESKKILF